jgi:hypothetical protein
LIDGLVFLSLILLALHFYPEPTVWDQILGACRIYILVEQQKKTSPKSERISRIFYLFFFSNFYRPGFTDFAIAIIFTLELVIRFFGLGTYSFCANVSNLFDLFVVVGSWVDIAFDASGAFLAFRGLRLLRLFRVLERWKRLKHLGMHLSNSYFRFSMRD